MAKEIKQKPKKKERAEKYDDKLAVNGSFIDIINAAVKDTKATTAQKQKK